VRILPRGVLTSHNVRASVWLVAVLRIALGLVGMLTMLLLRNVGLAEEADGKPAVLVPSSRGTSPMWVVCNARRIANVTLGMGHAGAGAHGPNEHILLDNYWRALRATTRLYSEFATAR
jgi:hypothetical protein